MKHGHKDKGKKAKAKPSGKKASKSKAAVQTAKAGKGSVPAAKAGANGKGRGADSPAFNNPIVANAFKRAVKKYPNAFRRLTD
jgi:hypothetical protein